MALGGPGNFGMHWGGRREKAEDYSPEEKEEEEEKVFLEEMQSAAVQGRAGITPQKKIPLLLLLRGHFLHCPKNMAFSIVFFCSNCMGGGINVSLHFCTH